MFGDGALDAQRRENIRRPLLYLMMTLCPALLAAWPSSSVPHPAGLASVDHDLRSRPGKYTMSRTILIHRCWRSIYAWIGLRRCRLPLRRSAVGQARRLRGSRRRDSEHISGGDPSRSIRCAAGSLTSSGGGAIGGSATFRTRPRTGRVRAARPKLICRRDKLVNSSSFRCPQAITSLPVRRSASSIASARSRLR